MADPTDIAGLSFLFSPPGEAEAFEIECMLFRLLAPGAAAGVAELAEALAEELVKLAREMTLDQSVDVEPRAGPQPVWDLARLLYLRDKLDSSDERLRAAWDKFTDALPGLAGDVIAKVTPEVTARLSHTTILRLFELAVLGHAFVVADGKTVRIDSYKTVAQLARGRPMFKWELLTTAILSYLFPRPDTEPSEDA